MNKPVVLHRYAFPSREGEGWAIVVLGSDGFFSAVSDYGNYAFLWSSTGYADFREFMIRISGDAGYVCGKLSRTRFSPERTKKLIREYVVSGRRDGAFDHRCFRDPIADPAARRRFAEDDVSSPREWARYEWDLVEQVADAESFRDWGERTIFFRDDWYEYAAEEYPSDVRAFCERVLKRLADALKVELAAERSVPASAPTSA